MQRKANCTHVYNSVILDTVNGPQADHEDGNGLNNRRRNLRPATHGQNQSNKGKFKKPGLKSRYVGVSLHRAKWQARITKDGRDLFLGTFDNEWDAALAYNLKAAELRGKFARFNRA